MLWGSTRPLTLSGEVAGLYSVPPVQLLKTTLFPFWSTLSPALDGDPAIVSFYVGLVALSVAAWGAWKGELWQRRLAAGCGAAAVLSLGSHLPGFSSLNFLHVFRFPANWLLLTSVGIAVLAAKGVSVLPKASRWPVAGLIALELILFAQTPRTAWSDPDILEAPGSASKVTGRIYHAPDLMALWKQGTLDSEEGYLLVRDFLAPSFGTAFGVREVASYQQLRSLKAARYEARLRRSGPRSDLAAYAGISHIVALSADASRIDRSDLKMIALNGAEPRIFTAEGEAKIRLIASGPGDLTAEIEAQETSLIVFSEAALPGWQVSIDGKKATLEEFEGTFLAARVPSGTSRVSFRYRPGLFILGAALSLLSALCLAGFGLKDRLRRA